jgi:hypothetical protein
MKDVAIGNRRWSIAKGAVGRERLKEEKERINECEGAHGINGKVVVELLSCQQVTCCQLISSRRAWGLWGIGKGRWYDKKVTEENVSLACLKAISKWSKKRLKGLGKRRIDEGTNGREKRKEGERALDSGNV